MNALRGQPTRSNGRFPGGRADLAAEEPLKNLSEFEESNQ